MSLARCLMRYVLRELRGVFRTGAFVLLAVMSAAVHAAEPLRPVRDPYYGDSLFYFYQEQHFTALTRLMVSQHFARLPKDGDEVEILRGGMFLSYGLHREAAEIFEALIERRAPLEVRDRAWFYLAKIRHQRGLPAEAEAALDRILGALPPELDEERSLLRGNLLMARGENVEAARVLSALDRRGRAGPYARFNLGVALIRSGDRARGAALLEALGAMRADTEESWTLRDRANVALGFAALQADDPQGARAPLQRVRLSSLQANRALLGFGWAAAALKQPKAALVPWLELEKRDPSDAAVLEAKLAVPYAYAELGAPGLALEGYQGALAAFDRENARLDESIAAIRAGRLLQGLLQGLLQRNAGGEMGWLREIGALPEMPHAGHLTLVLAQHEFQEAFKNYRDLDFLARNLQQRRADVPELHDMLAHRREAFAQRLPDTMSRQNALDFATPEGRHNELAAELARAESAADGVAFANDRERELLARLNNAREALAAAERDQGPSAELGLARERLRRVAGALSWHLARERPARAWDASSGIQALQSGLRDARRNEAALEAAKRDEPARLDRFAARVDAADRQIVALVSRVAELTVAQRELAQDVAVAELQRQKEQLADYVVQARFAIAQLYDRSNVSPEGGARVKP